MINVLWQCAEEENNKYRKFKILKTLRTHISEMPMAILFKFGMCNTKCGGHFHYSIVLFGKGMYVRK